MNEEKVVSATQKPLRKLKMETLQPHNAPDPIFGHLSSNVSHHVHALARAQPAHLFHHRGTQPGLF